MSSSSQLALHKLFNVKGKTAVVTGGGSGLGEAMATALCASGARVIIASRKEKQLKEVAERLTKEGPGSVEYVIADIGSREGCEKLAAEVKKRAKSVQILVNNSGTTWGAKYEDFPEKEGWDRVLNTNVKAVFYLTAALTPLLAKGASNTNPSRVINISSVAGLDPKAEETGLASEGMGLWSYNTSKGACNHLTRQLAVTLAPKFITVNAILPGVFKSKMTAWALDKGAGSDKLASAHPMGRIGTPEDIGGVLLFLVSRASAHLTGNLLALDGGAFMSGMGYSKL